MSGLSAAALILMNNLIAILSYTNLITSFIFRDRVKFCKVLLGNDSPIETSCLPGIHRTQIPGSQGTRSLILTCVTQCIERASIAQSIRYRAGISQGP